MIDSTPPEGQPKERVIEINEWFTPFEDYDQIPYDKPRKNDSPEIRHKGKYFQLANVGAFNATLWWANELVDPDEAEGEKYLLILPATEKIIDGRELKSEQEKMELRPMALTVEFEDSKLIGKTLPFNLEAELPSGTIISADFIPFSLSLFDNTPSEKEPPSTFDNWKINGESFHEPIIPEVGSLIGKLQFRFVPKE